MPGPVALVRVIRSKVEESVHLGSVAVTDARGELVASAGDPERVAFLRSATKPFQAAVSFSLAGEAFSDREAAVACASHNGEPVHLEAVRALLARAGVGEEALRCPPGLPLDPEAARAVDGPRPLYHNCSGKHAAMVLACLRSGLDAGTYLEPDHPLQLRVGEAVAMAAARAPVALGVDGCGVPVHALPIRAMAGMYARLATPAALGPHAEALSRAVSAMRAEPYVVAGRRRVDTAVMRAAPGLVVKAGAEGLLCAAALDRGWGMAIKIEDGGARATGPALVRTLASLGLIDEPAQRSLESYGRPAVRGGGRPVGRVVADFELLRP